MKPRLTRYLVVEASTDQPSVALVWDGQIRQQQWSVSSQASSQVLKASAQMLSSAGATWQDLQCVAFGEGPGAFTGLRTACSVAQGLALGADLPVLPLPTLGLVAWDALRQSGTDSPMWIWVVQDARMGEFYSQWWRWDGLSMHAAERPSLDSPTQIASQAETLGSQAKEGPVMAAGSGLSMLEDVATALAARGVQAWPQARPWAQAAWGWAEALWAEGGERDAALAMPVYVRDRVAQTTAEREGQSWQIQAMGPQDIDSLLGLEQGAHETPWGRQAFEDALQQGHWGLVLRGQAGDLWGFAVAMAGAQELHLLDIVVHEPHQRRGLARAMLKQLEQQATEHGLGEIWLEVRDSNAKARALYKSLSYREVGRRPGYYASATGRDGREDAILMTRVLAERAEGPGAEAAQERVS